MSYELRRIRTTLPWKWLAVGVAVLSFAMSSIVALSADAYMNLGERDYWALIATQGGTHGWPPLYAYLLAIWGVAVWASEVRGEAALVTYLSFRHRLGLACVRIALAAGFSAILAVLAVMVSVLTALILFDHPFLVGALAPVVVKCVWMVTCGVGMTCLGGGLCMLFRSGAVALALLVLIPFVVEPVIIQVIELVPRLHALAPAGAFLPFKLNADVVGGPVAASLQMVDTHEPRIAAVYSVALSAMVVLLTVAFYVRRDAKV